MKTRRSFLKTGVAVGAGLSLSSAAQPWFDGNAAKSPSVAAPATIYTFDARTLRRLDPSVTANAQRIWDTMHLLAALQGLANREAPRLYLLYFTHYEIETDEFWLDWFRGEDGWLKNTEVQQLADLTEALKIFRDVFDGLVVYDANVPATSNLASTACGVERLLPVRFDTSPHSLFTTLTQELKLPVRLWLIQRDGSPMFTGKGRLPDFNWASSGSAKVDAYRWAEARWLAPGLCGKGAAAYYLDAFWLRHVPSKSLYTQTLSNHDWFIAHRAFFFDLSPWGDEPASDDPKQPLGADRQCLLSLMRHFYDQARGGMVKVGGFPPWELKYSSESFNHAGKHGAVRTEWEFTSLISQFNAYLEADCGVIANASFYRHYPLHDRYLQPNPKPTENEWRTRGWIDGKKQVADKLYVGFYVGDYDGPAWLYRTVPNFFSEPNRVEVPLGWAFDPNLADRAPQALAYAYRHATASDFFIAGDSGAGYLNPRRLTERPDSRLPSGLRAWQAHCHGYFQRWDMTITGFLIDGSGGRSTEAEFAAYRSFSPDGLGTQFDKSPALEADVAECPVKDMGHDAQESAQRIANHARQTAGKAEFLWLRSTLKSPAWYATVTRCLQEQYADAAVEVVDPYTFFGLIRIYCAHPKAFPHVW